MTPKQIHIQWEMEALSLGLKLAECQADYFHLLVKLIRNEWIYILFNKTNRRTTFPNLFCQARPGWNCSSILVVLETCHQTCMTYTSAECTTENP